MRKLDKFKNMMKANILSEQRYIKQNSLLREEVDGGLKKRKIIVLVGPPSVGKSTWIKSNFPNSYVISRDDIVEEVASTYNWTYDDLFSTPPEDAKIGDVDEKYGTVIESPSWMTWADTVFDKVINANNKVQNLFNSRVKDAHPSGKVIVVDMTNMNSGSRKGALKAIEGNEGDYIKIAVDFKFKGSEELIKQVANNRAESAKRMGKSKTIPPQAFDRMFKSYEQPSKSEGFDEIISVDNISNLQNYLYNDVKKEKINEDFIDSLKLLYVSGYEVKEDVNVNELTLDDVYVIFLMNEYESRRDYHFRVDVSDLLKLTNNLNNETVSVLTSKLIKDINGEEDNQRELEDYFKELIKYVSENNPPGENVPEFMEI
tara:strand:+ start:1463 stop:2581 length:1119 start_codon:yes stop_codon:yes gene_type:complete